MRGTRRAGPGALAGRAGDLPQRGDDPGPARARTARRHRAAGQAARTAAADRGAVRDHERAEPLQPRLPRRDRLRHQPVAGDAEGEARLPLPEQALGPDRPAAALRPERGRAPPGDRNDQGGCPRPGGPQAVQVQGETRALLSTTRGELCDLRSPGCPRRRHSGAQGRPAGAVGGRPGRHGADPAARLPQPLAAAAAGDRARRGGADFRDLRPPRWLVDDGLDRRAADPDRASGRLRDPAPGQVRRGGRLGCEPRRRRRSPGGSRGRAGYRNRWPRHRCRLPGAPAFADPDGARLRLAARSRDRDCFPPGLPSWVRGPPVSGTGGSVGCPGATRRPVFRPNPVLGWPVDSKAKNPASGGTPDDPAPGAAPDPGSSRSPSASLAHWAGSGDCRMGPGNPDRNADRYPQAGAAERRSRRRTQ